MILGIDYQFDKIQQEQNIQLTWIYIVYNLKNKIRKGSKMVNTKRSICFLCIGLGLLSTLAFIPLQNEPESPVFFDDFEKYLNNNDIKKLI